MSAVAMWLRTLGRRRWRAWTAIALLGGLAGGAAMAAAAGARRTDSAYPRLLEWSGASDLSTGGTSGEDETFADEIAMIEKHPLVLKSSRNYMPGYAVLTANGRRLTFPQVVPLVLPPGLPDPYRARLLRGRLARPDRPDEATVSFSAEAPGLGLGDTVHVVLADFSSDPPREALAPIRIVGVHVTAGEFRSVSGVGFPVLNLSPALFTRYREYIPDDSSHLGLDIWIKGGVARVEEFIRDVSRQGIHVEFPITVAEHTAGVRRSMRFESGALWLLAALIGVAGAAITAQAVGREAFAEAATFPTVRALGMTGTQLLQSATIRAAIVGVASGVVATALAATLSPLTPIGLARIAEPHPGFRLDATVFGLGALATMAVVILIQMPYLWKAARARRAERTSVEASRTATFFSRVGAPPSAVAGMGMADRGSRTPGTSAVRAATVGTALGVAAFTMALGFGASMRHLVTEPRLSGYVWDALLAGDVPAEKLESDPSVLAFSHGGVVKVEANGSRTTALALDKKGPLQPVLLAGRVPQSVDEVSLGSKTMRDLNAHIGSTIRVTRTLDEGESENTQRATRTMTVVGRAVVPSFIFQANEPGEGIALTTAAAKLLGAKELEEQDSYFVRFRPGTDINEALADPDGVASNALSLPRQQAGDLQSLNGIANLPMALAAIVAAIGGGALAHALVQTVRSRRRDLAILKTLGFVRHELRATVAWQTSFILAVALGVGIPAGLIAGRAGWRLFADQLSVLPEPRISVASVLLLIPVTLALANGIGALPARAAARTQAAMVLRTE